MTWWVSCKCGNIVVVDERHDRSGLPCPACRQKGPYESTLKTSLVSDVWNLLKNDKKYWIIPMLIVFIITTILIILEEIGYNG